MSKATVHNLIVLNDSFKADGFVIGIEAVNALLKKYGGFKFNAKFIEDYVSDDGEFAFRLTMDPVDQP